MKDTIDKVELKEALQITGFSAMTIYRRIYAGLITPLPKPPGLLQRHRLEFLRADVLRLLK